MLNRGSLLKSLSLLILTLVLTALLTISTAPTKSFEPVEGMKDTTAQIASFGDCSVILNTSTIGSIGDICVDSDGYLYTTGSTNQPSFPIVNGFDHTLSGSSDCFVIKMNGTDGSVLYSTFLGGNSTDYGNSICVDVFGCIYVLGVTYSQDFPLVNPYSDYCSQSPQYFLTKFAPDGQTLVYSTFFGPEFTDVEDGADFNEFTVDEQGYVYLTGSTRTSEVPIINAFDDTFNGATDCYILKLNPTGTEIVYASFYGTEYPDSGSDLFFTSNGTLYVSGTTSICPTDGYYVSPGPDYGGYCFVLKIARNGTLLNAGSVKSPDFFPSAQIVVDSQYSVYLMDGSYSAWSFAVYKLDDSLERFLYTKVLGGSNFSEASDFSIDSDDRIYIAGRTFSEDFIQNPTNSLSGMDDCFLLCMNLAGGIIFSNLYGSENRESISAIAVADSGQVYLAGSSVEPYSYYDCYYRSFILSIRISTYSLLSPIQVNLVVVGGVVFTILILALIRYRKH